MKTFGIQFILTLLLTFSAICQTAWKKPRLRSSPYGFGFPFIAGKSDFSPPYLRTARLISNEVKSTKCDSSKATSSACDGCVSDKCSGMFQGDSSLRCALALAVDGAGCLLSDYDASLCLECFLEYCSEECNRDRCNCCGQKSKLKCEVDSIGACPNIVSMCKKASPDSCPEDVCSVCNPEECSDTCSVAREEVVEVPKADPVVPPSKVIDFQATDKKEHSAAHPTKVKAPSADHKAHPATTHPKVKAHPAAEQNRGHPAVPTPKGHAPAAAAAKKAHPAETATKVPVPAANKNAHLTAPTLKVQARDDDKMEHSAPAVPTPKVQASAVSTPKVQASAVPHPKVQAPAVSTPKVQAPVVHTPKVQASAAPTPMVQAPASEKVAHPAVPVPKLNTPADEKMAHPAAHSPTVKAPTTNQRTQTDNSGVHHITRNLGSLFGLGRR